MSDADRDALKVELEALTDPYAGLSSRVIAVIGRNALTTIEELEVTAKVNYGLYKSATADLDAAEAKIAELEARGLRWVERAQAAEAQIAAALAIEPQTICWRSDGSDTGQSVLDADEVHAALTATGQEPLSSDTAVWSMHPKQGGN